MPTHLGEPEFDEVQRRAYGRTFDVLAAADVSYLVGGAIALNRYTGIWRDTKDLDLFVRPDDVDRTLAAFEAAGFETETVDEVWLFKAWAEDGDAMIDVICRNANGTGDVRDDWWLRSTETRILGRTAPIVSAEDTLLSKIFVGFRDRWDGADVLHLIRGLEGKLDWDHVLTHAGEHWELLLSYLVLYRYAYPADRGFVPQHVYEQLLHHSAQADHADGAGFRGTMFDSVSFRVDVDDQGLPDPRAALRRALVPDAEP